MANEKNDSRILDLKKQVENKKADLAKRKVKFTPETNCILSLDGAVINLNVLNDENTLLLLAIKLNIYIMSADNLEMPHPQLSGYSVDLWIKDIKNKLDVIILKKEETELKQLESKLDKLLSEDKKTELEIDEIASLLK